MEGTHMLVVITVKKHITSLTAIQDLAGDHFSSFELNDINKKIPKVFGKLITTRHKKV